MNYQGNAKQVRRQSQANQPGEEVSQEQPHQLKDKSRFQPMQSTQEQQGTFNQAIFKARVAGKMFLPTTADFQVEQTAEIFP